MSTELDRNLEEVTELALKTGEQIVSLQCPCCSRTFYATKSEAAYEPVDPADTSSTHHIKLGRKCPFCGFAGGVTTNSAKEREVEQMRIEMEAEEKALELAEKRQTPWSQVCSLNPDFNTRGDNND